MAKDCSFDVVSEFDKQELVNAIDQVKRDLTSRFDLKNSNSDVLFCLINVVPPRINMRGNRPINNSLRMLPPRN